MDAESVQDAQAALPRQHFKVGKGADADVGCVEPLVGQHLGHRHAAARHTQAVGPVRKVGKTDDANAAHTCCLAQHAFGVAQVLHGVELQHHIETLIVEDVQAVFQVELNHIHATLRAGQHVGVVQFDAVAAALLVRRQVCEQLTTAATQVEHTRALRHQAGDRQEVGGGLLEHGARYGVRGVHSATLLLK